MKKIRNLKMIDEANIDGIRVSRSTEYQNCYSDIQIPKVQIPKAQISFLLRNQTRNKALKKPRTRIVSTFAAGP